MPLGNREYKMNRIIVMVNLQTLYEAQYMSRTLLGLFKPTQSRSMQLWIHILGNGADTGLARLHVLCALVCRRVTCAHA